MLATPEFADTAREAAPGARVISSDEFAELESGGESPIVDARRRRPRGADVHRRHDRPREGRDALAREPLARRQGGRGLRARARDRPVAHLPPALARVRAARDVRRAALDRSRAARCSCAGSTRRRGSSSRRSTARRSSPVVPSMLHLLLAPAARGVRPLRAALHRVGRGAARAGGRRTSSARRLPGARSARATG